MFWLMILLSSNFGVYPLSSLRNKVSTLFYQANGIYIQSNSPYYLAFMTDS